MDIEYFTLPPSSDDLRYDSSNSLTYMDIFTIGMPFKKLGANPVGIVQRIGNKAVETSIKGGRKSLAWTKSMKNSLSGKNLSGAEMKRYQKAMNSKLAKATMIGAAAVGTIVTNWSGIQDSLKDLTNGLSNPSNDYKYGSKKINREKWIVR